MHIQGQDKQAHLFVLGDEQVGLLREDRGEDGLRVAPEGFLTRRGQHHGRAAARRAQGHGGRGSLGVLRLHHELEEMERRRAAGAATT